MSVDPNEIVLTLSVNSGGVMLQMLSSTGNPILDSYFKFLGLYDSPRFIDDKFLSRLPHTLVSKHHNPNGNSDHPLSKILKLGDSSDNLTPDFIEIGDSIKVTEIKTTISPWQVTKKAKDVISYYEPEVKRRCLLLGKPYNLIYIIVSKTFIHTNDDSIKDTNGYVHAYNVGLRIKEVAIVNGWTYDLYSNENEDIQSMLSSMTHMTLPGKATLPLISKESLSNWQSYSKDEAFNHARRMFEKETVKALSKFGHAPLLETALTSCESRSIISISNYVKEHDSHPISTSMHQKAVVQLPLFFCHGITKSPSEFIDEMKTIHFVPNSTMSTLWHKCLSNVNTSNDNYHEKPIDNVYFDAISGQPNSEKSIRRKHFRVKPELCNSDKLSLAKVGIEAKKYDGEEWMKLVEDTKKKGFKMSVCLADIDQFISGNHLKESFSDAHPSFEESEDMYYKAAELLSSELPKVSSVSNVNHFFRLFHHSKLGISLSILSQIIEEVNISRMHYCSTGEFVLKALKGYPILLLIKPTSPGSHVFFSVAMKKSDCLWQSQLPFKSMELCDDLIYTDFVSLNLHTVTHNLYLSEKMGSFLAMWLHLNGEQMPDCLTQISEQTMMHFNSTLLFWLEGKEQTSKECQLIRYAYMDVMTDNPITCDPMKILSKWDPFSRSRLCVWMRRNVMSVMCRMSRNMPHFTREVLDRKTFELSQDKVEGLLSWVTGSEISRFEIALNLSYYGVLHNKEHQEETHGNLKIFSKVIKEELKMRNARADYMGQNVPSDINDLRDHEFDPLFVAAISDKILSEITKKHPEGKDWILEKVKLNLIRRDLEALATMKKSASGDLTRLEHSSESRENVRITCLEACIRKLESGLENKCMSDIGRIYDEVREEYGGIVCNLFKKQQIGGVREIFVLEFRCRIVVHFLETISRTICYELDNEMLTKGDKKLERSETHFRKISEEISPETTVKTIINSDDATTWAQRFVMPVFGCMFSRLLPDEFLEPCLSILNLVTNKRLELPSDLLDLFDKYPSVDCFDENVNELKYQYLGVSTKNESVSNDLTSPRCRFLNNKSNMMQGILHYTSSLLHSGYLLLWEEITTMTLNRSISKTLKFDESKSRIFITTKVSSDDSSVILSLSHNRNELMQAKIRPVLQIVMQSKISCYKLMCAEQSLVKSTSMSFSMLEEFNSLWYCRNTLLSPIIKFIAASIRTHPTSRMDDRFHGYSNLRASVLENSGSIMLTSFVQRSQLMAHYKTLGMNVNKMWGHYKALLLEKPHPAFGFFLIEHPLVCGIMGHASSLYYACSNKYFKDLHLSMYNSDSIEFTEDGRPTTRTYLSLGQSEKFFRFKKDLELDVKSMMEELDSDPSLIFTRTKTSEQALLKLRLSASNPALAESFSFATDSKLQAASVYILQEPAMLISRGVTQVRHERDSLLRMIKTHTIKASKNETEDGDHNKESSYSWLFPLSEFYEIARKVIKKFNKSEIGAEIQKRSIFCLLRIEPTSISSSTSLMDVCLRKWFNDPDVRGTAFSHNAVWEHYKKKLTWLNEDIKETLKKSPFDNYYSLKNFISSLANSSRTSRVFGPSERVFSPSSLLESMITNCQWKGRKLSYIETTDHKDATAVVGSVIEKLWRAISCPPSMDRKDCVIEVLKQTPDFFTHHKMESGIYELSKPKIAVAVLSRFVNTDMKEQSSRDQLFSLIERFNLGVLGSFSTRQKWTSEGYRGVGVYNGKFNGQKIEVHVKDTYVRYIKVDDLTSLKIASTTLKEFVKNLGWTFICAEKMNVNTFWDFNKSSIVQYKTRESVAVIYDKQVWLNRFFDLELFLEVGTPPRKTINITAKDGNRKFVVFSYTIRSSHIESDGKQSVFQDKFLECWMNNKSLELEEFHELWNRGEDFRNWCSDSIKLRALGTNRLIPATYEYIEEGVADELKDTSESSSEKKDYSAFTTAFYTPGEFEEFEGMFDLVEDIDEELDIFEEERLNKDENLFSMMIDNGDFDYTMFDSFPKEVTLKMSTENMLVNKFWDKILMEIDTNLNSRVYRAFLEKKVRVDVLVNKIFKEKEEFYNKTISGKTWTSS